MGPAAAADDPPAVLGRPVPYEVLDPPWLEARAAAQLRTAGDFGVPLGFRFSDRLAESGIRFTNRVVEDAGITYKAVHYDHGNGSRWRRDGDGLYVSTSSTRWARTVRRNPVAAGKTSPNAQGRAARHQRPPAWTSTTTSGPL
jgi:hypothetical protein